MLHRTGSFSKLKFFPEVLIRQVYMLLFGQTATGLRAVRTLCVISIDFTDDLSGGYGFMVKQRRQVKP